MGRFLLGVMLALCALSVCAQGAMPVRGLIVRLKDSSILALTPEAGSSGAQREQAQARRERLKSVAGEAGVDMETSRALGNHHQLLRMPRARAGADLDATMRRLRLHPQVESVEPDVLIPRLATTPNDTAYSLQWHLDLSSVNLSALNMPLAWDRTLGNTVTVAVLDTGVRPGHPELAGRLLPGYDMVSDVEYANDGDGRDSDPSDPGDWVSATDRATRPGLFGSCSISSSSWHGTFIAGQIAAITNNAQGVAGMNWSARILPVRVSGKCGAFLSDILDGLRWAAGLSVDGAPANPNPARVINLSFGGDASCASNSSYQSAIDDVTAAGVLVVVAAGNEGGPLRRPADCRRVMAVGAVQDNGVKATYSNFGSNLALMAPGGNGGGTSRIYSLDNSGTQGPVSDTYGYKSGTSFSAPLAAGVASLMLAINPSLTPSQLIARMKASARAHVFNSSFATCTGSFANYACNCTTSTCGAGLLDGEQALVQAQGPSAIIASVGTVTTGVTITLDGSGSQPISGSRITQYRWTQTLGELVTINSANSAVATVTMPATAGTFEFRLSVTDDSARTGDDTVSVVTQTTEALVAAAAATSSSTSSSSGGGGGGAFGWGWGAALWLLAILAWMTRPGRQTVGRSGA